MGKSRIFENVFVCDRHKEELIPLILGELNILPQKLLEYVFEKGYKIYLPKANNKPFFVRNGLSHADCFWNGKMHSDMEVSRAEFNIGIVLIADKEAFLTFKYPHSIVLHEMWHVIDFALGFPSFYDPPKGPPLDWYAATNHLEKFAVAGEAFCHPELFTSSDYRTHNKWELFKKAPEHFAYFEQLFKDWQ